MSDKVITQQSGFLKKVEYSDDIMAGYLSLHFLEVKHNCRKRKLR